MPTAILSREGAMDHLLTEEQRTIRDLARTIAEEKVKPVRAKYDEEGTFPWDIVRELAKVDLFRVFIPVEYDGLCESGYGITNMCIVTEELSKACAGIALAFAGTALGTFPILLLRHGRAEAAVPAADRRRARSSPPSGSPSRMAGSDASAQRTTARPRRRRLRAQRHQGLHHQRRRGRHLHHGGADRPREGRARRVVLHRREGHAGVHVRQDASTRWASAPR